jgi:hypothetical protein
LPNVLVSVEEKQARIDSRTLSFFSRILQTDDLEYIFHYVSEISNIATTEDNFDLILREDAKHIGSILKWIRVQNEIKNGLLYNKIDFKNAFLGGEKTGLVCAILASRAPVDFSTHFILQYFPKI